MLGFLFNLLILLSLFVGGRAKGDVDLKTYSFLYQAHAPNAGGQTVYAVKRATREYELSLFANEYLQSGGYPVVGVGYDERFAICGQFCVVQAYALAGCGLSTGGPYFSLGWSIIGIWALRIDFATQIYLTKARLVTWSVPVWFGFSLPLPW